MIKEHHCRVCGLYNEDPPWGDDGNSPNYEFCPCCGIEFGNQDYTIESAKANRSKWINKGAIWDSPKEKPDDWNLEEQLKQIPLLFK
jgi:hypothetical protein